MRRIPALLRTRFNVNEILTSLMLTYVAIQLLSYLVAGPWKDPTGYRLPADARCSPPTRRCRSSSRAPSCISASLIALIIVALVAWFVMSRSVFGFQIRVVGSAPHAARYGGFSRKPDDLAGPADRRRAGGLAGMLEAGRAVRAA